MICICLASFSPCLPPFLTPSLSHSLPPSLLPSLSLPPSQSLYLSSQLAENDCLEGLVDTLACAWQEYGSKRCAKLVINDYTSLWIHFFSADVCVCVCVCVSSAVLFAVIPDETEVHDQRTIELDLWRRYCPLSMRDSKREKARER